MKDEKKKKKGVLKSLLPFTTGIKKFFIFSVILSAVSIGFNFLMPQVIRITIDSVIGELPFAVPEFLVKYLNQAGGREFFRMHLIFCASGVVLFSLISGITGFYSRMNLAKGTETMIKRLRDGLFAHAQKLPFSWHTKNQTGDIIQRCTSDVDVVRNFVATQLLEVIRTTILVVTALVLMFSMNQVLSLIALLFIPVVILYSSIFYRKIAVDFRKADEAEGDLMISVQETMTGIRVVRAFAREAHEVERFEEKNNLFSRLWIKLGYVLGIYWGTGDLVTGLQVLTIIVVGAAFAARGEISLGEFLVFVSYNQTLAWPVRSMGRVLSEMSKTRVSVLRIKEILDAPVENMQDGGKKPDMHGDITFKNVTFCYEHSQVLKNLNFTIQQGTTFGILGGTGSGKSTITYLLNRLYDIPDGCGDICFGDVSIKEISREYLRKNVGLVLQEPFLFSKTIMENIGITSKNASLERVRQSASVAAVDDAILDFQNGYDTIVGERGVTLSGGQKQRVAIARTLMMNTPVMVFDDSMSAVDLETDERIRDALHQNTKDATVVLISHRINTLMHADRILVLDNGAVAEMGSHQELIEKDGIYKRIYMLQSSTGEE